MKTRLFFVITVALMLAAGWASAQDATPSATRGQETYMRVGCYQCHGTNGQGNDAGPALTPKTLPAVAMAAFVRLNPGRMPVYPQEVLSDAEIADIVAFLQSVPPPPDADSIDLLRDLKQTD